MDERTPKEPSSGIFTGASPKLTFLFGVASGVIAALLLGGIFIIPQIYAQSKSSGKTDGSSGDARTATTTTAPTGAASAPTSGTATQPPAGPLKAVGKDDHIRGGKNPQVYLVEYSDFECPFCKRFHPTMQRALQEYGDKVAWVYRHFPLSFHANAEKEDEASECANELGGNDAFWKYSDTIFERTTSNGTGFALDQLVPLAKEIGLNEGKFKSCLDSGKYAAHVNQDISEGTSAGVGGTPTTFLLAKDGTTTITTIPGALPYEQVKPAIDQALAKG